MNSSNLPPPSLPDLPPPSVQPSVRGDPTPAAAPAVGVPAPSKRKTPQPEAVEQEVSLDSAGGLAEWVVAAVRDCVAYPWRKGGWSIVIPGAIFAVLLWIGSFVPVIGVVPSLLFSGYLAAYFFDIIGATISGKDAPPEWPEISNFIEDIVRPALQVLALSIIAWLPSLAWKYFGGADAQKGTIPAVLYVLGCIYHPMACIAVVLTSSINSALPHRVIPAIIRSSPGYFAAVVTLLAVTKLGAALTSALVEALPLIVALLISWVVSFCLFMMHARLVGAIGRRYREVVNLG